jgi:hypothetical protein
MFFFRGQNNLPAVPEVPVPEVPVPEVPVPEVPVPEVPVPEQPVDIPVQNVPRRQRNAVTIESVEDNIVAPSTKKSYISDITKFFRWCLIHHSLHRII